jgi:hypothetical protein
MLRKMKVVSAILVGMKFLVASGLAAEAGSLQSGAARIEITRR